MRKISRERDHEKETKRKTGKKKMWSVVRFVWRNLAGRGGVETMAIQGEGGGMGIQKKDAGNQVRRERARR